MVNSAQQLGVYPLCVMSCSYCYTIDTCPTSGVGVGRVGEFLILEVLKEIEFEILFEHVLLDIQTHSPTG